MNGRQRNDKSGAAIPPSRRQIIRAGGAALGAAALASFPAPRIRAAGPVRVADFLWHTGIC